MCPNCLEFPWEYHLWLPNLWAHSWECHAGIPSACALTSIQAENSLRSFSACHIQSLYTCVGYVVQFLPRDSYAKRSSGVDSSDTCWMAM